MYHGKQYKDLEGIVADVLDIHQGRGCCHVYQQQQNRQWVAWFRHLG